MTSKTNCSYCKCSFREARIRHYMKCGKCNKVRYCSSKCKTADYDNHEYDCGVTETRSTLKCGRNRCKVSLETCVNIACSGEHNICPRCYDVLHVVSSSPMIVKAYPDDVWWGDELRVKCPSCYDSLVVCEI